MIVQKNFNFFTPLNLKEHKEAVKGVLKLVKK